MFIIEPHTVELCIVSAEIADNLNISNACALEDTGFSYYLFMNYDILCFL